ncbi:MAG TPA: DUF932 domain-containing protein [Crocinitomicaceae bacterium]|nr:DUF932 domain-containing protein [Crocinitomicaceae bacterium]
MKTHVQYGKDKKPFVNISNQKYDFDEIDQLTAPLKIFNRNGHLITEYAGMKICEKQLSSVYGIFDFSSFIREGLPHIHHNFNAQAYNLNILRGVQQLKVFGDELVINDDIYKQVFNVFSSTNGYYPLSISVGLFRQVCSNGMVVPVKGLASFNIKTKHFHKAVENHILDFQKRIPLLEDTIFNQQKTLEGLFKADISLKKVVENLILKPDSEREEKKTLLKVVQRLGKKFIHSETDKIIIEDYAEEQIEILKNPTLLLTNPTQQQMDIELNKYNVYNCYMELFRERNTAIIEKESKRILEALEV